MSCPDLSLTVKVVDWRDVTMQGERNRLLRQLQKALESEMRKLQYGHDEVALSWTVWRDTE